jgi:hypothetical protein
VGCQHNLSKLLAFKYFKLVRQHLYEAGQGPVEEREQ